jgi:hypothetical protein
MTGAEVATCWVGRTLWSSTGWTRCWISASDRKHSNATTHLVVVNVLLSVDSFGGLNVLLGSDMLLDDLGCDFGADLGGVLLVGSLILVVSRTRVS